MQTIAATVKITNELGLHARAASLFVKTALKFSSNVNVKRNGQDANGKSIMSLIMLTAQKGSEIEIIASGEDAADCVAELKKIVNERFGEER